MVCNSGVSLTPVIDGRTYHFGHRGLHNGLSVLGDAETGSHWDHITGRCLSGPMAGREMETGPLLHVTAGSAVHMHPNALTASSRPSFGRRLMGRMAEWTRLSRRGFLPPGFRKTMNTPDARRPLMELGLGVWTERVRRFYPLSSIRSRGGVVIDSLGDRGIMIYFDLLAGNLGAIWTEADSALNVGSDIQLSDGSILSFDWLIKADGSSCLPERPMQLFTRWYGFSFTFPNCEIGLM